VRLLDFTKPKLLIRRDECMLKKTVTYVDYNGVERTEDFYFNLSKAEVTEMELSVRGGLSAMLEELVKSGDNARIVEIFKDLVLRSYGEKSADGKRFVKSKELSEAFSQTEAYSEIFMELALDEKAAAAFVNGILPANLTK
jgi:hypothetical protein